MISPDDPSPQYMEMDALPEGRTMGNLILLPDGRVFCLNGAKTGQCSIESVIHLLYPFFCRRRRVW